MKFAKQIVLRMLEGLQEGNLELVWKSQTYRFGNPSSDLRAVIAVHHERFFERALFAGDIGLGESYMRGEWSSPDLVSVVRLAVRNLSHLEQGNRFLSLLSRVANIVQHRMRGNTLTGSRKNIHHHYDLGNEFYKLFLDPSLAYSCAYFLHEADSLEQAQLQKFDRICRKLRLSANDHLLEIGTGWGGFAVYAASRYGCRITTTTISREQHDYAAAWFAETGLSSGQHPQVELLFKDYRRLSGRYDKIVSIEMFEAVGLAHYDDYFGACDRLLDSSGSMVIQTISMNERSFPAYARGCDWIQKYIFPGAELASLIEVQKSLRRCTTMSLHNAEDIGWHYAQTLNLWRTRFLDRLTEVRTLGFDEVFIRMWDYYLAYCEGAFRERHIGDFQLLLAKQNHSGPLMYEPWEEVTARNIVLLPNNDRS
jgi:Cyclopropane fatty acid synthase and related methyltransferases